MKFVKPFVGATGGSPFPTTFNIGDECPPDLIAAALEKNAVVGEEKEASKPAKKETPKSVEKETPKSVGKDASKPDKKEDAEPTEQSEQTSPKNNKAQER